ncbi:unnamed protein product, partial [Sphenostylis stenocarpa]
WEMKVKSRNIVEKQVQRKFIASNGGFKGLISMQQKNAANKHYHKKTHSILGFLRHATFLAMDLEEKRHVM